MFVFKLLQKTPKQKESPESEQRKEEQQRSLSSQQKETRELQSSKRRSEQPGSASWSSMSVGGSFGWELIFVIVTVLWTEGLDCRYRRCHHGVGVHRVVVVKEGRAKDVLLLCWCRGSHVVLPMS